VPTAYASRRRPGRPTGSGLLVGSPQVLDVAEALIAERGTEVTVDDIAHACGVTKPIIYRTVGDKAALVDALAERLVERLNRAVMTAVADRPTERDMWARIIEAYLDTVDAHRHLFIFVTAAAGGADPVGRTLALADRSARPMAALLAAHSASDPERCRTWAYGVIGMLHFSTLDRWRQPVASRPQMAHDLTELVWSGVGGSTATIDTTPTGPSTTKEY
jgi:AcrR family transcriptional regulator